uniref:30S ribosomal protein S17, chloroplastic n=1 Tax=Araucaria cunninghamii TaxID=56994 RepID=A0A0D6QZN5_ARACU
MAMATVGLSLRMPIATTKGRGSLSSFFWKGSNPSPIGIPIPISVSSPASSSPPYLQVRAAKTVVGRVVWATNDKTVRVEVTRLAPHPLYKKRLRYKKDYQVHDPLNQFKKGDMVELKRCRPISKTKSFLAVPLPPRNSKAPQDISLPLQSSTPTTE